ncbi:MAG: tetratricopeptide repeat protein [Gemmatimonadota bacterium]
MLPRAIRSACCICALLAATLGGAAAQSGQIPLTTSSPEARQAYLEGRDLFEKLRAQDARPLFQQAVAADPGFAVAHLQLAFTEPTFRGFFDEVDRAVALSGNASEGEQLWIRGVKAGVDGRPMDQRAAYRQLVAQYPGDARAHTLLGNQFFGTQEYELAIASYEAALAIDPAFSQPYNQPGYAYRFLGNYERAGKTFQKYVELIPGDPNPYDSYAELLMKTGRFQDSIAQYRKALEIDPRFAASHLGIATDLIYLGDYEGARRQLRLLYLGAQTSGQRRAALQAEAISWADEGNLGRALRALSRECAIADSAGDAAAMAADLGFMGDLLLDAGAVAAARAVYEKARDVVQVSDLSAEVKANNRRNYLYDAARLDVAEGDLDGARAKAGKYAAEARELQNGFLIRNAHELAGAIALAAGDGAAARAELALANQLDPYNLYRLAQACRLEGDAAGERQWLERTAGDNTLNSLNYALVRHRARAELAAR